MVTRGRRRGRSERGIRVKFYEAIDWYISDMRSQGRLNSDSSERGYRSTLEAHAADVGNRDPAKTAREDVKRTLRRWPNPNTQGTNRAKLVSLYGWGDGGGDPEGQSGSADPPSQAATRRVVQDDRAGGDSASAGSAGRARAESNSPSGLCGFAQRRAARAAGKPLRAGWVRPGVLGHCEGWPGALGTGDRRARSGCS